MSVNASDYLENKLLDHITKEAAYSPVATVYCALYTAFTEGGTQTEVADASYARQSVTFSAAASRATANTNTITFPSATTGWTNSHFAICDNVSGGNVLYWGTLAISVGAGEVLEIAIGDIDISHGQALDGISDDAANKWLDLCLRNQAWSITNCYCALFTAWTDDTTKTEAADGGYARQDVGGGFSAASGGTCDNDAAITFPAITGGGETYTHVALMDASTGGNILARSALAASKAVGTGEQFRFPAGDLDLTCT